MKTLGSLSSASIVPLLPAIRLDIIFNLEDSGKLVPTCKPIVLTIVVTDLLEILVQPCFSQYEGYYYLEMPTIPQGQTTALKESSRFYVSIFKRNFL